MFRRRLGLVVAVVLLVTGCSSAGAGATPAATPSSPAPAAASPSAAPSIPPAALTVFAAASLKAAFGDVKTTYEAAHPGTTLTFSFDASSALETQIAQGGPADVFASADTANPQKLVDAGLAGPITRFAGNTLTMIVPTANPAGITSPLDLAKPGTKVVAAGDAVPITKYANQLLDNLAGQPGYPADFASRVKANVVSKEDNVAAVVSKIALGEGDAAIVYVTDAQSSTDIRPIAVPDAANVPATYGAVVPTASRSQGAAGAFVAWLAGPDGQAVMAKHGFLPPPS